MCVDLMLADPTIVVIAFFTSHMTAASILENGTCTVRTGLSEYEFNHGTQCFTFKLFAFQRYESAE